MKRILSIVLVLVMISCTCVFAQTIDETGLTPWAKSPFLKGVAGTFPQAGVILLEQDGEITLIGKDFKNPTGLTTDTDGNLYVSDAGSGIVYRITPDGKLKEFATRLSEPTGLCWADGKLYVAETGKNRIVIAEGTKVTVVAGKTTLDEDGVYAGGYVDGLIADAEFDHPQGVAAAADGRIFVADTNNHVIRMIQNGRTYTVSGSRDLSGDFVKPAALRLDGDTLLVSDLFTEKTVEVSVAPVPFTDVAPGAWYEAAVNEAALRGITSGTGNGLFSPSAKVTRAQFVCFIANAYLYANGNAVINGAASFNDVPAGVWYGEEAGWASDMGVVYGTNGAFNGGKYITRQELVAMLYRYAKAIGLDTSKKADLSSYSDFAGVASYAKEAFSWAVGSGIVSGFTDGTLRPAANADRAQCAVMLTRLMK